MNDSAVAPSLPPGDALTVTAGRVALLLDRAGLNELAVAANDEAARVRAGVCRLVVAGEFKRGKSSLINALIEAELLPVGALPLTAIGTRVELGTSVHAVVEFLDGRQLEIDPATIAEYATERGNPGNHRRVAAVTLTTPASLLRVPLCVVDTPGIGSTFADVSDTARALLADADAALIVLSAEQPASRRELDFLREVIARGVPTFVVENKIDLVPFAEQREVLAFVREQIDDAGGEQVRLFPVSAEQARRAQRIGDRLALRASGVLGLEEALIEFVQRDGARTCAYGCRRRLLELIEHALPRLELHRRAGPTTEQWQEQRRTTLLRRINVALFCDMRDADARLSVATRELILELSVSVSEAALVQRLERTLAFERLPAWRRGQSMRRWAVHVDTCIADAWPAVISGWSDAEQQVLAAAVADLTTAWPARGRALLSPILGESQPPAAPPIDFQPPVVNLPPRRFTAPPLLPGAMGRWQVRRRAWRWMRATLPATLRARRVAIDASVSQALRRADGEYRRQLGDIAERMVADATRAPAPQAGADSAVVDELRSLRARLQEDCNGP